MGVRASGRRRFPAARRWARRRAPRRTAARRSMRFAPALARADLDLQRDRQLDRRFGAPRLAGPENPPPRRALEVGRDSVWEKGCQFVLSSCGAAYLKKKTKYKQTKP